MCSLGRERLLQQKQLEIQQIKREIEQMKLQSDLSIRNVETANISSTAELKNTIIGRPNEVAIRNVQRESDIRHCKALVQQLQKQQKDTEYYAISLKIAL